MKVKFTIDIEVHFDEHDTKLFEELIEKSNLNIEEHLKEQMKQMLISDTDIEERNITNITVEVE